MRENLASRETQINKTLQMWRELILQFAKEYSIDPVVLAAVIHTESRGDMWSTRQEENYRYPVHPREWADRLGISYHTELTHQGTSWGLMHVMGGVAREYGFDGQLPQLIVPELSMKYGCKHLRNKAQKYGSDPCVLYAAYNGGSPRYTPGGMFQNQANVDNFYQNLLAVRNIKW